MTNRSNAKRSRYESANHTAETTEAAAGDELQDYIKNLATKDAEQADEAEEQLNKMQATTESAATMASTMTNELKKKDDQIERLTTQMTELTKAIASLKQNNNNRGRGTSRDNNNRGRSASRSNSPVKRKPRSAKGQEGHYKRLNDKPKLRNIGAYCWSHGYDPVGADHCSKTCIWQKAGNRTSA